jgi:hypothetical protein
MWREFRAEASESIDQGKGLRPRVQDLGLGALDLGHSIQDSGFKIKDSGLRIED